MKIESLESRRLFTVDVSGVIEVRVQLDNAANLSVVQAAPDATIYLYVAGTPDPVASVAPTFLGTPQSLLIIGTNRSDTISYNAFAPAVIDGRNSGDKIDVLANGSSIVTVNAGNGDDVLVSGGTGTVYFFGGNGDDTATGTNVIFDGGRGADVLTA